MEGQKLPKRFKYAIVRSTPPCPTFELWHICNVIEAGFEGGGLGLYVGAALPYDMVVFDDDVTIRLLARR